MCVGLLFLFFWNKQPRSKRSLFILHLWSDRKSIIVIVTKTLWPGCWSQPRSFRASVTPVNHSPVGASELQGWKSIRSDPNLTQRAFVCQCFRDTNVKDVISHISFPHRIYLVGKPCSEAGGNPVYGAPQLSIIPSHLFSSLMSHCSTTGMG